MVFFDRPKAGLAWFQVKGWDRSKETISGRKNHLASGRPPADLSRFGNNSFRPASGFFRPVEKNQIQMMNDDSDCWKVTFNEGFEMK